MTAPRLSRRAMVYMLSQTAGLPANVVGCVLDWTGDVAPAARMRVYAAAARHSINLPSRDEAKPPPIAPEPELPRPPRATDAVPRAPLPRRRGRKGKGSIARRREAFEQRRAINHNPQDTAP